MRVRSFRTHHTFKCLLQDELQLFHPDNNGNLIEVAELQTTPQPVRSNGFVDFRVTGRDIRLKIEIGALPGQPRPGVDLVTVGQHLIDAVPRGDR